MKRGSFLPLMLYGVLLAGCGAGETAVTPDAVYATQADLLTQEPMNSFQWVTTVVSP